MDTVKKSGYGLLPLQEHDDDVSVQGTRNSTELDVKASRHILFFIILASVAGGLSLGFLAGQLTAGPSLASIGINTTFALPSHIFTNRRDVAFRPYREYMGPSKEAARNWEKLTRESDSIYLSDPVSFGLQDAGIKAPFFIFNDPPERAKSDAGHINNFYVLNTLHQMHCVHMIRMRYNSLVYEANATHPLQDSPLDRDWITHLEHCFEYLRLSITCADYMTLESDSPPGSPDEYWKDGLSWGVVHSCIDWDALMEFQEQQVVAYNRTWS